MIYYWCTTPFQGCSLTQGILGGKIRLILKNVSELFNNKSYSLMSYAFKEFHHGLAENIVLSLPPQKDDCQLTAKKAKI